MPATILPERGDPSGSKLPHMNMQNNVTAWKWIATGILLMLVSGCIQVSDESWTVSHRRPFEIRKQASECTAVGIGRNGSSHTGPEQKMLTRATRRPALNTKRFSLVSWNVFKGKKAGWAEDFQELSQKSDILVLQEAYLTHNLKKMLRHADYHWDMSAAFEYRNIEAGVLTAARTAPTLTCAFRETEPLTRIPKSILITRYPLSRTAQQLLVANIHAINLTLDISVFQKQLDRLEAVLATYRGPLIVAGDFNTWNSSRMSRVTALAQRLGLTAVEFDNGRRSRFLGHPVDHVYYRGLETKRAATSMVSTSDHNPLMVVFKLADEPASGY